MTWPGRPCYVTAMRIWKVAGINFDHMHMGDLLRMAFEHPSAEIVSVCDEQPARMQSAIDNFKIANDRVFMETDNAHVIALNRFTGELLWDTELADSRKNYAASSAPPMVSAT